MPFGILGLLKPWMTITSTSPFFQGVEVTNNGDLTKDMPGLNISFGDYACRSLVHDVATGARVEIKYQLCQSPWFDTGLVTTQPFCCVNGDFPEDGNCP